jgi:hypothetical protein
MVLLHTPASEAAMIALFLKSEWKSPERWRPQIKAALRQHNLPSRLIMLPDLTRADDNAARKRVFDAYRHYSQRQDLFEGFPSGDTIRWHDGTLSQEALHQVRYMNYSYWNKLSDGTRLATKAAEQIQAGERAYNVANDGFYHLAALLREGTTFPPLIVVGTTADAPLVLLEGHARLTAYMLEPRQIPFPLRVMVGLSPQMPQWTYF